MPQCYYAGLHYNKSLALQVLDKRSRHRLEWTRCDSVPEWGTAFDAWNMVEWGSNGIWRYMKMNYYLHSLSASNNPLQLHLQNTPTKLIWHNIHNFWYKRIVVFGSNRWSTNSSDILEQLHWLPIEWRIKFKIASITCKKACLPPLSTETLCPVSYYTLFWL